MLLLNQATVSGERRAGNWKLVRHGKKLPFSTIFMQALLIRCLVTVACTHIHQSNMVSPKRTVLLLQYPNCIACTYHRHFVCPSSSSVASGPLLLFHPENLWPSGFKLRVLMLHSQGCICGITRMLTFNHVSRFLIIIECSVSRLTCFQPHTVVLVGCNVMYEDAEILYFF